MITLPQQPPTGDPCNGCGACCIAERCLIAVELLGPAPEGFSPCPALEWEDGRHWCGFVRRPSHYHSGFKSEFDEVTGRIFLSYLGDGSCDAEVPEGTQ